MRVHLKEKLHEKRYACAPCCVIKTLCATTAPTISLALFDTGSTYTAISVETALRLGIRASRMDCLTNSSGIHEVGFARIYLSLDKAVFDVEVAITPLPEWVEVLIGMDIITKGKFVVNGDESFEFIIDYEKCPIATQDMPLLR